MASGDMTGNESREVRGIGRRTVLRRGLLAGFGITVAGATSLALAGTAYAASQGQWRWCSRCQGLFYGPQQSTSICPGAPHHTIGAGSFNYSLTHDSPPITNSLQSGWYWCSNCKGSYYGGIAPNNGRCPISPGALHVAGASYHYLMWYNQPGVGQPNWRWCKNCQGLFHLPDPSNPFGGECPASGAHDGSGSYLYDVEYS